MQHSAPDGVCNIFRQCCHAPAAEGEPAATALLLYLMIRC